MWQDDEEFKEWEFRDQEIPEKLQRKWQAREKAGEGTVRCPACGQHVSENALLCLFCGSATGIRAGVFSHLRYGFAKSGFGLILFSLFLIGIVLVFLCG